jgi:hypothetical protein
MKDPAEGTATVVSYQAFTTPGLENNTRPGFEVTLHAQVVVQAEGLEPTAVEFITNFPQSELPLQNGAVLPVTVDRKNPKHLKLDHDFVKQAKIDAEGRLAAVAQSATDQARQVAVTMREGASSSAPGSAEQRSDDPIVKLEHLAMLRDGGVLTEAEFEQQKQRLLGSS